MKRFIISIFLTIGSFAISMAQLDDKQVILFMIDGLHWQAPEKLHMPVFNSLIEKGTYIQKSYMLLPHHPTIGDYSKFNSCSFPNPVLHQGTIFLKPENKMIQEVFSPEQQTAFVVNTSAYRTVSRGFSTCIMDETLTDEQVVTQAIEILETQHPVFMRIHMQTPGSEGFEVSQSAPDKSYYMNIFANASPYIDAVENADKLLGRFIAYLKESGAWSETVLIITSDHGQSNIGWHPMFDEDSWMTPLLFVGPGIAQGRTLSYFEHTDLAPTIAGLLGKKAPNENGGRGTFIKAILTDNDPVSYQPPMNIKTLNEQIKEFNFLKADMVIASKKDTYFSINIALLDNESASQEPFYHQDRITDWYKGFL